MMRLMARSVMVVLAIGGCSSDGSGSTMSDGGGDAVEAVDCTASTSNLEKAICQANGFLGTLTADAATANPTFANVATRTKWSNLPGTARAGVKIGSLNATSQAAALALMATVLSEAGVADLTGVRNADDYLATQGGSSGGGGEGAGPYGAANYYLAIVGIPSTTGNWAIMFGGHHMAYNLTYVNGVAYPTPNHLGVEPKAPFTINDGTFMPMADEGAAMVAVFKALDATALNTAYLQNQTFTDVLIGPVEYGAGSSALAKAKFPTGDNRTGVLVSSLTADQQALVSAAIRQWVADYDASIATDLLTAYTSATAYQDTYVAWGGSQASGIDVDVNGFYMRLDGPRLWIEMSCQAGAVIQGVTHYHSIYRDKSFDYANTL